MCDHSNTSYSVEYGGDICNLCGDLLSTHSYTHQFAPYNFDLNSNYQQYNIEQSFNFLNTYYSPIIIKQIKSIFNELIEKTGKISNEFVPVSIYYGLKEYRPLKPIQIDKMLGITTTQRYIAKYSDLFNISYTDPQYIDKRKFPFKLNSKDIKNLK